MEKFIVITSREDDGKLSQFIYFCNISLFSTDFQRVLDKVHLYKPEL